MHPSQIKDFTVSGDPSLVAIDHNKDLPQDTLFFIVRSGTPDRLIPAYINILPVNLVNFDGQNFLFFLDPAGLCSGTRCYFFPLPLGFPYLDSHRAYAPHTSTYEFLSQHLKVNNFNFAQIDHEGRSFLSCLCMSPNFDVECLLDIVGRYPEWKRLINLSSLRDVSGCFLLDYLALNPNHSTLGKSKLSAFAQPDPKFNGLSSALWDTSGSMGTGLDRRMKECAIMSAEDVPLIISSHTARNDINKYEYSRQTPLMIYLHQAVQNNKSEKTIFDTIQRLITLEANTHARSREGSNVLHFAAKKGFPDLIKFALDLGVQPHHVNVNDLTALDYAAKLFDRSRNWKSLPEVTARSLKVTTMILAWSPLAKVRERSFWKDMAVRSSAAISALRNYRTESTEETRPV